ncbi:SMP-30/gluconolactonase/LRE family protein, partial [Patulibacter sp.]|uniref:SMP-30/gluconolactonase/LRE family protein n=1 Tax=Patulibacter sp. TaxID=1912859 RepID=UPI0027243B30
LEIDPEGGVRTELAPVTISNGLGFAPDGRSAYYVDSPTGRIDRLLWSAGTGLHTRRPWVRLADAGASSGAYDGLAVDADGGVWVALYGGGAVHRYDERGRLDVVVELPVRQPTAVAFDGPDLLVTTSRHGLGDAAEPAAGALFRIPATGTTGAPVHEYAG